MGNFVTILVPSGRLSYVFFPVQNELNWQITRLFFNEIECKQASENESTT